MIDPREADDGYIAQPCPTVASYCNGCAFDRAGECIKPAGGISCHGAERRDEEEVIFIGRAPIVSDCDHVLGLYCGLDLIVVMHSSMPTRRITRQTRGFDTYEYCPRCGTKLAPIFADLERDA